jgi:hypothetical protein
MGVGSSCKAGCGWVEKEWLRGGGGCRVGGCPCVLLLCFRLLVPTAPRVRGFRRI